MNTPLQIVIEILIFALVVLVSIAAIRSLEGALSVRRRLGEQRRPDGAPAAALFRNDKVANRFLQWVESSSLNDSKERNQLRRDLALAGFDHPAAPIWYVLMRFGAAIGLPILFVIAQSTAAKPLTGLAPVAVPLLLCGFGLLGPRVFVAKRVNDRKAQLEHEFPDVLDLIVVCVEAGLGLEAAFVRVGQEVRISHPRIAREFGRLSDEMSAGRGRADALRAMADRVDVDTVKSFVALMVQTDALGVSIGQTLRTYSVEMREHRFLKAEEKALRIPVLMTVPLVACILPVIITSLLLPVVIDVSRTLLPALRAQH
ncbi:type II secretion system F family protein [Phenylobacterium sp.]|jgi:tight adherence protein C|uniref:type II secretion system F family protein n=1 Tax=Phenylobacterium sp. TaxID=1871053 RepID=UPI002F420998